MNYTSCFQFRVRSRSAKTPADVTSVPAP
jgi:hypothetical protein